MEKERLSGNFVKKCTSLWYHKGKKTNGKRAYYDNTRNVITITTRRLRRDLFYLWCHQTKKKITESKGLDEVMSHLFDGKLLHGSIKCYSKHVRDNRSE